MLQMQTVSLRSPIHLNEICVVTEQKEIHPFKLLVLTTPVPSSTAEAKTILCSVWASHCTYCENWSCEINPVLLQTVISWRTAVRHSRQSATRNWIFGCRCFAAEGGTLLQRIPYDEGFHRFVVPIDRIGLKNAHVYRNPFVTVSVNGTDKTFRSLDNWHLQSCVESANMAILWSVTVRRFLYSTCETNVNYVHDFTQFLF